VLVARRVAEVVLGPREVQPERLLGRLQLVGREESFDQREAPLPHLVERPIRDPHGTAMYADAGRQQ